MEPEDLVNRILADYDERAQLFDDFRLAAELLLKDLARLAGLRVHSITSRLKERPSLKAKLGRIGKQYSTLEEITDVVGLRIITNLEDEVNAIGQLVERHFDIDRVHSIDKRQRLDPDRFGYLSLHYVGGLSAERIALAECRRFEGVCCEIQVRSLLQHAWAEVEHDLGYKAGATIPAPMRRRFSRLAGLLEIADSEFVHLRDELQQYANEVRVAIIQSPNEVKLDDVTLMNFIETDVTLGALEAKMATLVGATLESQSIGNLAAQLKYAGIETIGELATELRKVEDIIWRQWETRVSGEVRTQLGRGIGLFYLFQVLVVLRGGGAELSTAFTTFNVGSSAVRRARVASEIARSVLVHIGSK